MAQAQSILLPLELRSLLAGLTGAEVAEDQQWILTLLRHHGQAVVGVLWRMLGSEPDVLDAYQTAVCQLAAHGEKGLRSNRAGYFYRTAVNAAIGILRARQRERRLWPNVVETQRQRPGDRPQTEGSDHREALDRLRQAICELPPHLRNVIVLRDLAQKSYRAVAGILGIQVGTARLYRRQAVVRLADLLGRENPI